MQEPRINWDELMNRYIKLQADLKAERKENKRLRKALAYANKKIGNWVVRDTLRRIEAGYEGCPRCGGNGYEPGHRIPMDCTKCNGTGLSEPSKDARKVKDVRMLAGERTPS